VIKFLQWRPSPNPTSDQIYKDDFEQNKTVILWATQLHFESPHLSDCMAIWDWFAGVRIDPLTLVYVARNLSTPCECGCWRQGWVQANMPCWERGSSLLIPGAGIQAQKVSKILSFILQTYIIWWRKKR
jgi:hypothetical protein